jgi:hypothetical protein
VDKLRNGRCVARATLPVIIAGKGVEDVETVIEEVGEVGGESGL